MVIELKMFVSDEKITQKYIWNCVKFCGMQNHLLEKMCS